MSTGNRYCSNFRFERFRTLICMVKPTMHLTKTWTFFLFSFSFMCKTLNLSLTGKLGRHICCKFLWICFPGRYAALMSCCLEFFLGFIKYTIENVVSFASIWKAEAHDICGHCRQYLYSYSYRFCLSCGAFHLPSSQTTLEMVQLAF